jgi:hypothetical protein
MIEYLKLMITPPVPHANVIVSHPSDIAYDELTSASVHGVILLGEPSESESEKLLDILKPGSHVIMIPESIGHRGVMCLEDAGLEVRDSIYVAEDPESFHYCSKSNKSERESGLVKKSEGERTNDHPTVKPIEIMEWCLRDLSDDSQVVDPFLGSGTTALACARQHIDCVGIELQTPYANISTARAKHWSPLGTEIKSEADFRLREAKSKSGQRSLFD